MPLLSFYMSAGDLNAFPPSDLSISPIRRLSAFRCLKSISGFSSDSLNSFAFYISFMLGDHRVQLCLLSQWPERKPDLSMGSLSLPRGNASQSYMLEVSFQPCRSYTLLLEVFYSSTLMFMLLWWCVSGVGDKVVIENRWAEITVLTGGCCLCYCFVKGPRVGDHELCLPCTHFKLVLLWETHSSPLSILFIDFSLLQVRPCQFPVVTRGKIFSSFHLAGDVLSLFWVIGALLLKIALFLM